MGTPMGIEKLICLRTLSYKVREKVTNQPGIEELGNLHFLEEISIKGLQNVKNPIDAEGANLKEKQNLRDLRLLWDEKEEELDMRWWEQKSLNFQVFEALQPPTGLKELAIYNFMGCNLPTWMCVESGLQNMVRLKFVNCKRINQLPAVIGQLPRLRFLYLTGMSLTSLDIGGFPSLVQLFLTDMFLLENLCYSYPPYLQILEIDGCKSLTDIPLLSSLTMLKLQRIHHNLLCSVGRNQTSLTAITLENIEELIYYPVSILQNNCNLQVLSIKECDQFEGFGVDDENENEVALRGPKLCNVSLQKLDLIDCPVLKFLPDLRGWTSLQRLLIFNCPQVQVSLTYDLKSLSFLQYLWVDFIQRNEQRRDPSDLKDLINLMMK